MRTSDGLQQYALVRGLYQHLSSGSVSVSRADSQCIFSTQLFLLEWHQGKSPQFLYWDPKILNALNRILGVFKMKDKLCNPIIFSN